MEAPDGKKYSVRLIGRRSRDLHRRTDCIEIIVEDLTERLALQKQACRRRSSGRSDSSRGIAHDFNNMIGAILGWGGTRLG